MGQRQFTEVLLANCRDWKVSEVLGNFVIEPLTEELMYDLKFAIDKEEK